MQRIFSKGFLVLIAALVLGLLACEQAVDWDLNPQENGQLVVEALITNEVKIQELRLSESYNDLNGQAIPASNANVRIRRNQQLVLFAESTTEPGLYRSQFPFAAGGGVIYVLEIEWNGEVYTARNWIVPVFPLDDIRFARFGNTDSVTIAEVGPVYHPVQQSLYEIEVDWSHIIPSDSSHAKLFYYTFNSVDVSEIIRPPSETIPFPRGARVYERKYGLDDEFAEYLRALLLETQWQGGFFDEAPSSLPTNISNGGLGFFSVSAVLTDTLIAE